MNEDTMPTASVAVPFSSGTRRPALAIPANACDCHMHVYDSRIPAAPNATLRPPDASVADYRRLQQRIGTERTVVVTPSTYGIDNRVMLGALRELGASARGVAVVDASVSDGELEAFDRAGVRGIRFNLSLTQVATIDMLSELGPRVAELGWHVQLLMPPEQLLANARRLESIGAQIVFDHFGRIPFDEGTAHPAFRVVAALLESERAWVKLSGAYLGSLSGSPYRDVAPLARAFVDLAPDRIVWGSDWPHVVATHGVPDDAELIDLLPEWAPDAALRHKILVTNPARLYGF